jgi:spore coat protein CotH
MAVSTTWPRLLLLGLAAAAAIPSARPRAADDVRGRDAVPDYARVFPLDQVRRLDITISAASWDAVLADMTALAGSRGGGAGGPGRGGAGGGGQQPGAPQPGQGFQFPQAAIDACSGQLEAAACSVGTPPVAGRCIQTGPQGQLACIALPGGGGGQQPVGGGAPVIGGGNQGRDDVELLPRNPIYVPADLGFDGETFRNAGFRFKGNSSLLTSWRGGTDKMPFRLNIDGLESRFPDSRDQTFFGFTNLSFSNGALDSSYLRAKVVTDLLRDAGLPVARTAFVRVFLNRGSGPFYLGLYTMTEVPDSPYLARVFGSDGGNLYKPNGTGGRWTVFNRNSFPKRTNRSDEDWTDIEDAIAAVNAPRAERAAWRQRIEARFDVNGFLRWLAANTIIGNFDAYGGLSAHNYYLYGSPRHRDRLFWIPWDHDLAMSGGGGFGGGAGVTTVDLFHQGIAANWPLIRFFMDDPVYRAAYRAHVEDLLHLPLDPGRVGALLRSEQARIAPFVIGPEGEVAGRTFVGSAALFDAALLGPNGLIAGYNNRVAAVRRALAVTP